MAQAALVSRDLPREAIEAGKLLVRELDRARFPVPVAAWLYSDEAAAWRLYIATPEVRSGGPMKAYATVLRVLEGLGENARTIRLEDIYLVDLNEPRIQSLRKMVRTSKTVTENRFINASVGDTVIEDSIVYRST
ncbi:MAG: hypothetical protein K8I02_03280 [Candidatus Methylomirabilis sp.]|nr:hypothetical protein [Deltaproteobacteria bacterium]